MEGEKIVKRKRVGDGREWEGESVGESKKKKKKVLAFIESSQDFDLTNQNVEFGISMMEFCGNLPLDRA